MKIKKDEYEVFFKFVGDKTTPIYETDIYKKGELIYNVLSTIEKKDNYEHKANLAILQYKKEKKKWEELDSLDLKTNQFIVDKEPVLMGRKKYILLDGEIIEFYFWGHYISPFFKVSVVKEAGWISKKHKPVFTLTYRRNKIYSFKKIALEVLEEYRKGNVKY